MDAALFLAAKTDRASLVSTEDRGGVFIGPPGPSRLVVADGAASAHRSGLLAELIVASFRASVPVAMGDNEGYARWRSELGRQWRDIAAAETGDEWYLQENLRRGSAAAFAAAVVDEGCCWCVAVGDCCLFQIRRRPRPTCVSSFPVHRWSSFDSTPALLHTDGGRPAVWPQWARLEVRPGDVLVGASDGMAEWVLGAAVQNPEVWELLVDLSASEFERLLAAERELGTMVDDDTVVVRLAIGGDL